MDPDPEINESQEEINTSQEDVDEFVLFDVDDDPEAIQLYVKDEDEDPEDIHPCDVSYSEVLLMRLIKLHFNFF